MPARRTQGSAEDKAAARPKSRGARQSEDGPSAPAPPPEHLQVIERRIRRLQQELDALGRSRPWGPALGFTAAWLGLIVVFVGLVSRTELVWLAGVIFMLAGLPAFLATVARRRQEARLRAQIDAQERRLEAPDRSPADRLLEAHLDQMDRHFRLVSDHADRGFLVGVAISGVGILLIALGLVLGFRGGEAGGSVAWVAAVSGLGMQAIAGLLFIAYARGLHHLQGFQERMERTQKALVAFTEASELSDAEDRDRVIAGLIAAVVADDDHQAAHADAETDVRGLLRRASS
jgi:hypothetical protein